MVRTTRRTRSPDEALRKMMAAHRRRHRPPKSLVGGTAYQQTRREQHHKAASPGLTESRRPSAGMLRRLWRREWIEAEAYAEDEQRALRLLRRENPTL